MGDWLLVTGDWLLVTDSSPRLANLTNLPTAPPIVRAQRTKNLLTYPPLVPAVGWPDGIMAV